MKKEIKERFPNWCNDTENYDLILSDDIDSLMCYSFQKKRYKREVKYFFDVSYKKITNYNPLGIQKLYGIEGHKQENQERILGLDLALEYGIKTWDNHIVKISDTDKVNSNSANMNIAKNIYQGNYNTKYIVSSFITMLSYYEVDISRWTKDQLSVLCSIDGLYTPFDPCKTFAKRGRDNLRDLGYEFLADFIIDNTTYIQALEKRLNIKKGKIKVNNLGTLETDIDLVALSKIFKMPIELPVGKFISKQEFRSKTVELNRINEKKALENEKALFNFALIYKNKCVISA